MIGNAVDILGVVAEPSGKGIDSWQKSLYLHSKLSGLSVLQPNKLSDRQFLSWIKSQACTNLGIKLFRENIKNIVTLNMPTIKQDNFKSSHYPINSIDFKKTEQ